MTFRRVGRARGELVVACVAMILFGLATACGSDGPSSSGRDVDARDDAAPGEDTGAGDGGGDDVPAEGDARPGDTDPPDASPDADGGDPGPDVPDAREDTDGGDVDGGDPVEPTPGGISIDDLRVERRDEEASEAAAERLVVRVLLADVGPDRALEGLTVLCRYREERAAESAWDGSLQDDDSDETEGCWALVDVVHVGGFEDSLLEGHVPLPPAGAPNAFHAGWRDGDEARVSEALTDWRLPLDAPGGLAARGFVSAVRVTWDESPGAVSWEVDTVGRVSTTTAVPVFFDADADAPQLEMGAADATFQTRSDGVRVEWNGFSVEAGERATYRVRAIGREGDAGAWSSEVGASRGESFFDDGDVEVARSMEDNPIDPWTVIEMDFVDALDRTAPENGDARWYRFQVRLGEGDIRASEPARGARLVEAPVLRVDSAQFVGDTLAVVGTIASAGSVTVESAGFVVSQSGAPASEERIFPVESWGAGLPIEQEFFGFADGRLWEVSLFVSGPAGWFTSPPIEVLSPPLPPENVSATTNRQDRVLVAWSGVTGVSGYEVLRDGVVVATVGTRTWEDFDAPPPEAAPRAPEVDASLGTRADGVELRWDDRRRADGDPAIYTVRARNSVGPGRASAPAVGRRQAPSFLGWEVEIAGVWQGRTVPGTQFLDETAPDGSLVWPAGVAQASVGASPSEIFVSIPEPDARAGAERSYRVRAVYDDGPGLPSATAAVGYRGGPSRSGPVYWEFLTPPSTWTRMEPPGLSSTLSAIPASTQITFRATTTYRRSNGTEVRVESGTVNGRTGSGIPRVRTIEATNITTRGARVRAAVDDLGVLAAPIARGVCVAPHSAPAPGDPASTCLAAAQGGVGEFSVDFASLPAGAVFFARAYAGTGDGAGLGSSLPLYLLPSTPEFVDVRGSLYDIELLIPPNQVSASAEGFRLYHLPPGTAAFDPATATLVGEFMPAPERTEFGATDPAAWWTFHGTARWPELPAPNVSADRGTAAREIRLSFSPYVPPAGPTENYVVVPWNRSGEGAPSAVFSGAVRSGTVIGYAIELDDSAWGGGVSQEFVTPLQLSGSGGVLQWTDRNAPLAVLGDVVMATSTDAVPAINASAVVLRTSRPRTYRVEAVVSGRYSPPRTVSATANEGLYRYEFQSGEPDVAPGTFPFTHQLTSASSNVVHYDTRPNADGRRTEYRANVLRLADNAVTSSSTTAIGRRATRSPASLTLNPRTVDMTDTGVRMRMQLDDPGSPAGTLIGACIGRLNGTFHFPDSGGDVRCQWVPVEAGRSAYSVVVPWGNLARGTTVSGNTVVYFPTWEATQGTVRGWVAAPMSTVFVRP